MTYFPLSQIFEFGKWYSLNKNTMKIGFGFGLEYPQEIKDRFPGLTIHMGIDWTVPIVDVYSHAKGKLSRLESQTFGKWIIIDHGAYKSVYRHLSEFVAPEGDIEGGVVIAKSGNTGYANGYHLHFEIQVNGYPVDPTPFLQDALTIKTYSMKYVMNSIGDQYILLDPLKVAISIADVAELEEFKLHNLIPVTGDLITQEVGDEYMKIAGIRLVRIKDIFNL